MSVKQKEDIIKLHILQSLARSQRALATMIENMADISTHSSKVSKHLLENIETITKYQELIAAKLIGLRFRRRIKGKPAKPWLCEKINPK